MALVPDDLISYETIMKNWGIQFVDTKCRFDMIKQRTAASMEKFGTLRMMHDRSFPVTFGGCIVNWCDPSMYGLRREWWWKSMKDDPKVLGVCYGLHPAKGDFFFRPEDREQWEADLRYLVENAGERVYADYGGFRAPKCVGIGCGIDFSDNNKLSRTKQEALFEEQIRLASSFGKPLAIHCRERNNPMDARGDADLVCIKSLKRAGVGRSAVMHRQSFAAEEKWLDKWMAEFPNAYFGVSLKIFDVRYDRRVIDKIPLERILIESDSPFFAPLEYDQAGFRYERKRNGGHPGMGIMVALGIARAKGMKLDEVTSILSMIRENTERVYGV